MKKADAVDDGLMSVKDAGALLGVHERTVWSFIDHPDDPIPTYRIGRLRRIDRAELRAWIQRRRHVTEGSKLDRMVDDVARDMGL